MTRPRPSKSNTSKRCSEKGSSTTAWSKPLWRQTLYANKNKAALQLSTTIKFLDLLTGKKSITSDSTHYHQTIPENFEISGLPPEISSFVFVTLEAFEESWEQSRKSPGENLNEPGRHGSASQTHLRSKIHSLITSLRTQRNSSSEVSFVSSETINLTSCTRLLYDVRNLWWRQLCALPLATQTTRRVPCTSAGGLGPRELLSPRIKDLLCAMEQMDPPPKRQKAISTKFLKDMFFFARTLGEVSTHSANLAIGGFFFAMRAC